MTTKVYVGTFHSVDNVLYKIVELEAQGYPKQHIYAVSNIKDDLSMLEGDTDINLLGVRDTPIWDHTRGLFGGKDELLTIFIRMGFNKQEAKSFYNDLKEGGVALFVDGLDEEERRRFIDHHDSSAHWGESGEGLEGRLSREWTAQPIENSPRINTTQL